MESYRRKYHKFSCGYIVMARSTGMNFWLTCYKFVYQVFRIYCLLDFGGAIITYSCISKVLKSINNNTKNQVETNGGDNDKEGYIIKEPNSCFFRFIIVKSNFL